MGTFRNVRQPVLIARAVSHVGSFLLGLLFWIVLLVGVWSQIGRTLNGPMGPSDENDGADDLDKVTEPDGLRADADDASFTIRR